MSVQPQPPPDLPPPAPLHDPDSASVIAEYNALRSEILTRITLQQQVFALHLTASGAILSLALARPSNAPVLLVVPYLSYLLCGSFASLHFVILELAAYIEGVLSPKLGGSLSWETWLRRRPRLYEEPILVDPIYVAFPGTAGLALAGSGYYLLTTGLNGRFQVLLALTGLLGLVLTGLAFRTSRKILRTGSDRTKRSLASDPLAKEAA